MHPDAPGNGKGGDGSGASAPMAGRWVFESTIGRPSAVCAAPPRGHLFDKETASPVAEAVEFETPIEARLSGGLADGTTPGETPMPIVKMAWHAGDEVIEDRCCVSETVQADVDTRPVCRPGTRGHMISVVRVVAGKIVESVSGKVKVCPTATEGWGCESGPRR